MGAGGGIPGGGWNNNGSCWVSGTVVPGESVHPRMLLGRQSCSAAAGIPMGAAGRAMAAFSSSCGGGKLRQGGCGVVPGCSHSSRRPCVCSRP